MPNQITVTGLQTATQQELINQFTAAFQSIYGADINLQPDSPDGQMMMIFIQAMLDLEDLVTQVYNGFDPDNAIGTVLDQRVAINGIQRQAGTTTVTNITVGTSASVNLYGLDQTANQVFTVADSSGNQFQLQTTQLGFNPGAGGSALSFQAVIPGAVNPTPNTINVPVTIVLGVTFVNNPTAPTAVGINEESDAALKIRRQQSVTLASQGYLSGLLAALENIPGMASAFVYENTTDTVDADGVPGHSIWVIVSGTAAASAIAQAIYSKRNAGCGMFGTISYVITQVNGTLFTVLWSGVLAEDILMKFTVSSINGTSVPNIAAIRSGLVTSLVPGVFAEVNVNELATAVQVIDPNSLVTNAGVAAGWESTVSYDAGDIVAKLGILYTSLVNSNLNHVPPNGVYWSVAGAYSSLLYPSGKNKQFAVSAPNIIILPIYLIAANGNLSVNASNVVVSTSNIAHGGATIQFSEVGGYGTMVYSIQSGAGSIDSSSGLYTSATVGTDVVLVTDALGNTAICTITVT